MVIITIITMAKQQKKPTGFGPPMRIRFFSEELIPAVELAPKLTIELDFGFYLQTFRNNEPSQSH